MSGKTTLHTQSPVALAMSSPTFFGDNPRGPILGARAEDAPTSPPVALRVLLIWLSCLATPSFSRVKKFGIVRRSLHFFHFARIEFWSYRKEYY